MNTLKISVFCSVLFLIGSLCVYSQGNSTPFIHVISPNGGERCEANSTQTITWQSSNIDRVKIEFSLNGGFTWYTVKDSIDASLGQLSWKVPNVQIREGLIKIIDISDPAINDVSDKVFSIFIKPVIKKSLRLNKIESGGLILSDSVKIMPLGNSITFGDNGDFSSLPDSLQPFEGYRRSLYKQLTAAGFKINFVGSLVGGKHTDFDRDNEGHGGWVAMHFDAEGSGSPHALGDSLNYFLNWNPPNIVLLHIGTNDVNENYFCGCENIPNNIDTLLIMINSFNPNIKTFLAKIIDRNYPPGRNLHTAVTNLNNSLSSTIIPNLPTGLKQRVNLVDMYTPFGAYPNSHYSADSLHPDSLGYEVLASTWYTALSNYLPLLKLRVFLQGPYDTTGDTMTTKLGRSDLLSSPYSSAPKTVTYTVPDSITDWVLLEFRESATGSAVASKSCFLSKNGYVIDPDNLTTNISLGTLVDPTVYYYVVIRHRNHLAIMSSDKLQLNGCTTYDFTTGSGKYYGTTSGSVQIVSGVWGMIAGDTNGDGGVGVEDYSQYKLTQGQEGYDKIADFNCDGGVGVEDYSLYKLNQGKESAVLPY